MIKNKKGDLGFEVVWIFILMGLVGLLIVGYFAYALIAPIFTSTEDSLVTNIQGAMSNSGQSSLINASNYTVGAINRTIQPNIQWISYGILIMMFLGFITCLYFVRFYPFMIIFWILFCIIIIFASLYLSVSYQNIAGSLPIYAAWIGNDYLMIYLPLITIAFAIIGGIFLFITSKREETDSTIM